MKEEQFQTKKWFSRDAPSRCFYLPYRKGQPLHIVDEIAPISLGHPSTADEECVLCSGWPYTTSRFVSLHPRLCDTLIIHAYFNLFWPLLFFARPVTATANMVLEGRVHPFFKRQEQMQSKNITTFPEWSYSCQIIWKNNIPGDIASTTIAIR